MYRYAYLLGSSAFLLLWIPFFVLRKDLRRQMLLMSIGTTVAGLMLEYLAWTVDWWQPLTITNTKIGIEDIILGFTNGGLAAVLYEVVVGRRTRSLRKDSVVKRVFEKRKWLLWIPFFISSVTGSVAFWVIGWHSFWATFSSCLIGAGLIILLRNDLLLNAVFGGVAMVLVALPIYRFVIFIFPEVVEKFWLMNNLGGIMIWGIPIEDLGFYFAVGAVLAPLYEFVSEKKLVKIPKRSR